VSANHGLYRCTTMSMLFQRQLYRLLHAQLQLSIMDKLIDRGEL